MGLADRIYAKLPRIGQNAAVSSYGMYWKWVRFGPGFARRVNAYRDRDRLTLSQWDQWQRGQLKSLLSDALQVPHYRESWNAAQREAAERGELAELPLLEKDPLRADATRFLNPERDPGFRKIVAPTSGSTGTPIDNYWPWTELRETRAVREVRSAGWAGVSFGQPRATFSGRFVEPDPNSRGPFHRYNLAEKQVYFSAFHLRPEHAPQYVDALRRHRVRWLTGYAVSYYLLAQMILDQGLEVPPLQAVITTSEKVTAEMREVMERAYRCRVYEEYSTVENCVFASECEAGSLHVSPDVSLVEILRPDGSACDPGEPGEVVTTCLMRRYQPYIRYRVGDVATWAVDPCRCGRAMPVLAEVIGRLEDVLIGPDGRRMVRFHGVFVGLANVREGQVIQETRDRIRIKVVVTEAFTEADAGEIKERIRKRMGDVEVVVQPVAEIPRTKAGKFKAVVNLLSQTEPSTDEASQHVAH